MKKQLTFFFCLVFLFSVQAWGQTWNLTPTMTATLDGNGVLTISTTASSEAMPDYTGFDNPWYDVLENIRSVVIEDKVTTIGNNAFFLCSALTSITLPNTLETIGSGAFYTCGLSSITIPASVVSIGDEVFVSCSNLLSINVEEGNKNYSSVDGVLYNKDQTILYWYPAGKSNTGFSIPNSVLSIGSCAFIYCSNLTSVLIPNTVQSIGYSAFASCTSLTSVIIPDQLKLIEHHTFAFCSNLTSILIPNSVDSIGVAAFGFCDNLTDVTVNWTTPLSGQNDIFDHTPIVTLYVPTGTKSLYQADPVWGTFVNIVERTVVPDETQPVGADGKGTISLSLSIPSGATLTGSFEITFPEGMILDEQLTVLSAELSENFSLSFTYEGNNTWLIEIKSNALRRSTASEYTNIMTIAYTVNDSVSKGTYEASIKNLDFIQDNGTPIKEDLLTVPINVDRVATSIENIGNPSFYAYFIKNMLRIESSQAETITIYSEAGVQLYSAKKSAGSIEAPFS